MTCLYNITFHFIANDISRETRVQASLMSRAYVCAYEVGALMRRREKLTSAHSLTATATGMAGVLQGFELCALEANGIRHRVATVKGFPPTPRTGTIRLQPHATPLVMLLHGWPESWYSWRNQLIALAAAGYPVCAPDMRGFGGTDAPTGVEDYTVDTLCLDVLGIADSLGYTKIIAIGHDFGSYLAWHLALLHPEQVVAVCGMSVPYLGHSPSQEPLLARLQRHFGTSLPNSPYCATRKEQEDAKFHYILHHNLPHVAEEYDRNCEEALYRLYSFKKPRADDDPPEVTDKHMFPLNCRTVNVDPRRPLDARSAPGFWARLPRPRCLPSFLSPVDFRYFVTQFRERGFAGGLKWYQVMDANWFHTRHLKGKKIQQPSLFIVGADDRSVLTNHGGMESVVRGMKQNCSNLSECIILSETGHWIQQECHREVSAELLKFLEKVFCLEMDPSMTSKL